MRFLEGEWIYSPSDLTGFSACEHLTQLERLAALGEITKPIRDDPLLEVLSRRGGEHEANVLAEYVSAIDDVVEIHVDSSSRAGLERAADQTIDAMRSGVGLVYQATFLHHGWVGHADFLERVEVPSRLGSWSYEVADAKLARTVKPAALLQLCSYSEHVERIQGTTAERVHVLTGDGERHRFRVADLAAYYRSLKRRFLEAVAGDATATYPEPVEHCAICRWNSECTARRRADDHLSLVAGMRRDQTRKLVNEGVATMHALAETTLDADAVRIGPPAFGRLREQAALQVEGAGCTPPLYRILPPAEPSPDEPPTGFALLPEPTPGDLFLDLEGDPYALEGGLEYLFGIVEAIDGELLYHPFWAHDRADEKAAFEQTIDLITERRRRHPDMHVYHYASYERSTIESLMGAHGTRETEIDDLLRGNVLIDLYRVCRQSVRLSTESYSLKDVERLYTDRVGDAVLDAGSSIVWYERYLNDEDEQLLRDLESYNEADCASLVGLRDWLEERRAEAESEHGPIARPELAAEPMPEELADWERDITALAERLTAEVADDPTDRGPEEQARWVLAQLLWWHRREDKPAWWRYFERVERATVEELADDPECIGGLEHDRELRKEKKSTVRRYRFEPQDHKFTAGSKPVGPATGDGAGEIVAIGDDFLDLKRGPKRELTPHPRALIPGGPYDTRVQRTAIRRLAEWVADNDVDEPGPYRAARNLLLRRSPRVGGHADGSDFVRDGETVLDAACRLVLDLDSTCLPIQGPPGAGKTFTGAHMICTLLEEGRRVGLTAHTHSSITNLLDEVCKVAAQSGLAFRGMQKTDEGKGCSDSLIECVDDNAEIEHAVAAGEVNLIAGTSWLWARSELADAADVLFIDEAGQLSLANVVAVSGAASSLVLLGDPQQLAQPSQGAHPDGAGVSALQHALGAHETIPPDRGLFLDSTYRMHPNVCAFISEIAYEGRLHSAPGRDLQVVEGFAGLRFVPVDHAGNRVRSPEEAEHVGALLAELTGLAWIDYEGKTHELNESNIIIVAPYNAHVAEIRRVRPTARVGTVDKFQGREGIVAIYSMASSTVDEAPRGMNFLYDLHRFNVAVSRARAVGIVVCSPELLRVLCRSAEQMRLANALCRYVELASPWDERMAAL